MPDGDEIARFKIDTSDADAKLRALEAQFAKLRGQMEGGPGGAAGAAAGAADKDAEASGRAANETERLRGAKEKLSAVLNLTGSHLGETGGRLASLIELLLLGNRAVLGFFGALAGVGLAVTAWRALAQSIEDAVNRAREFEKQAEEQHQKQRQRAGDIGAILRKSGADTNENQAAALRLATNLQQRGLSPEVARTMGALGAAAGIQDVDALGSAGFAAQQGVTFAGHRELAAFVRTRGAADRAADLAALERQRQTPQGTLDAVGAGRGQMPAFTDAQLLFEFLRGAGRLGEFNAQSPGDLERMLDLLRQSEQEFGGGESLLDFSRRSLNAKGAISANPSIRELPGLLRAAQQAAAGAPGLGEAPGETSAPRVVNYNVGTLISSFMPPIPGGLVSQPGQ